jgi:hypothetical protein
MDDDSLRAEREAFAAWCKTARVDGDGVTTQFRAFAWQGWQARASLPATERRADGVLVPVNRWEVGIRRIVALLWGNRREFEVDEVVETVRALVASPVNDGDDEALVTAVLAAAPAQGDAP